MMFAVAGAGVLVAMVLALALAVRGPTLFDRILAVNSMATCTVLLIAVSGFASGRPDWLDLALLYALCNFITTLAVLRFARYGNLASDRSRIS